MTILEYRSNVCVSDLDVGQCTVHRAGNASGKRWWLLWFRVNRDTDGQPEDFAVPINPNGAYLPDGSGGKTWGLMRVSGPDEWNESVWQISPSINVLGSKEAVDGAHEEPSIWHQTPTIVKANGEDSWARGDAP